MMEKVIKLDREQIESHLYDGCQGQNYLAVAPDGSDHGIFWADNNRQWDPWPDGWLVISIPALDPDGSGEELEAAEDCLKDAGKLDEAKALIEAEDIGMVEAVERLAPDHWRTNREESSDWLAEAFLAACNGDGSDLNEPAPWGYINDYDQEGIIEPPAEFEWA